MKNIGSLVVIVSSLLIGACAEEGEKSLLDGENLNQAQIELDGKADGAELSSYVVVANRSDSTLAFLSNRTGALLGHVTSRHVGFEFEPTYVVHLASLDVLAVSDRKNSRVLIFDSRTIQFMGFVEASEGLFHMWPSADTDSLFVVADVEHVVDSIQFERKGSGIYFERDVFDVKSVIAEGKPHDVVADDEHFYVSVQQAESEKDTVLKVDQETLQVEGQLDFSLDTHLGMPVDTPFLLVPEQSDGELNYVHRDSFEIVSTVGGVKGAHGVFWDKYASRVFLANTPSSGSESLHEVSRTPGRLDPVVESSLDLNIPKAHNLVADFDSELAFVTHSGADSESLSIVDIRDGNEIAERVEVGKNPFGLTIVNN